MSGLKAFAFMASAAFAAPAVAQSPLDTPGSAGALIANACVTQSLDFPALIARAAAIAEQIGLNTVTKSDKVAVYGDMAAANVVFSREIDAMACALRVPAPTADLAYYETVRDRMQAMIMSVYPQALSVDTNNPSPHEEGYQWVFSVPRDRHFAASLTWQTEDGVTLSVGYSQIYE